MLMQKAIIILNVTYKLRLDIRNVIYYYKVNNEFIIIKGFWGWVRSYVKHVKRQLRILKTKK
ncbi:hypothetical protein GTNG_0928 [Geobacillus thermodenitrificans NG80-2]|uniref:Uncharacterized protein n=1 Tax=Geobacillus thermodenitrificans (strain NG80-2) TaxID=420246 RepID=A4ILV2_GEOTN|nr:hypothetical protein GTNG_0928 [Geobacillus thermodenitrificans NG80-2]